MQSMFRPHSILVLQEDRAESELMARSLKEARVGNAVLPFQTGRELVNYLQGLSAASPGDGVPTLMLLELKVRGELDGFAVLNWVRSHPRFRRIPIVVLTNSDNSAEINRAYDLGANSCLLKPFEPAKLKELLKTINGYWIIMAEKPEL
jgi:two-component system response regulator